ncbi:MAG: DUF2851 family protein [Proteiniphilum sp.]|nr:DUF2851 family protein [Proteiniphilum sp.]MDD3910111.1 DUF2851 family protein [Proteiniphilum sp.]
MSNKEQLLHYVWKFRLFPSGSLETTDGRKVEVIDPGIDNKDAGPDFFNAKIKIGGRLWAGNVEIHSSSDEWVKHGHQSDKAYNSVILHLAEKVNREVVNERGLKIPQCELQIPEKVRRSSEYLIFSDSPLPCKNFLPSLPLKLIDSYLEELAFERLERKANDVFMHLKRFNNSWDEMFYVMLSRNFGSGLNSDMFERLALSIPYKIIQKHSDNLFQVEALFFGQAGMLDGETILDNYYEQLRNEYLFLKSKYRLQSLDGFLFRRLKIRPRSFPQVRIAQLAALLQRCGRLFSVVIDTEDNSRLRPLLCAEPSSYWHTHYSFGKISAKVAKPLGETSLNNIIINVVSPVLAAYGVKTGDEIYCKRAVDILKYLKPERNVIVNTFVETGFKPRYAFDTQALIQLRREHCDKRKCFSCRFGHAILSSGS